MVVDVCAARPIDLAIIDGIDTMGGTEGPWSGGEACHAGVLVAGTNCVNTDAVATALMGYDPMARAGASPFRTCDNLMELAEQSGLGRATSAGSRSRAHQFGRPASTSRRCSQPLSPQRAALPWRQGRVLECAHDRPEEARCARL